MLFWRKNMINNWYQHILKEANEFTGVDGLMSPVDINAPRNFKANGLAPDGPQTLPGMITDKRNHPEGKGVKKVTECGGEPGSNGGCHRPFNDNGDCEWLGYNVDIDGEKYKAYKCNSCKHELKLFDIQFSKNPRKKSKDRRKKQKVRRLSSRVVKRYIVAVTPAAPSGSSYNNPANQMQGRLDLSEDTRVIPWDKMQETLDEEYDERKQRRNKDYKIIKVKGKDGKDKYIRVHKQRTGGDGVSPANTYNQRGKRKKDPRYNPKDKADKGNPGAWPHNRDDNQGTYNMYIDKSKMNSDMRERVVPWSQYIQERGNNGLLKPY